MSKVIVDAQLHSGPKNKSGDGIWDAIVPGLGCR